MGLLKCYFVFNLTISAFYLGLVTCSLLTFNIIINMLRFESVSFDFFLCPNCSFSIFFFYCLLGDLSIFVIPFLQNRLFFYSGFGFTAKLNGKYRKFLHTLYPHLLTASPTVRTCPHPQGGTFVAITEPTCTHHPTFLVHIRVHFWCCKFYGFG